MALEVNGHKMKVDMGYREEVVLVRMEPYAGLHEAMLAVIRERVYADGLLSTQIQNPSNAFEVYERSVSSGDHSFTAAHDGKFEYCFSNEHWSANSKEVSFNVHGIVYVPESEAPQDPLEKEGKCCAPNNISRPMTRVTNNTPHQTVKLLAELLAQVKDEQGYIVVRERTHRNTAESTNARVKWWSIFQMGVVVGEGIFQVWWLKRFFEVKDPSRPSFNKGALG